MQCSPLPCSLHTGTCQQQHMGKVCCYARGLAALRCISSSEAKNELLQPPKKVLASILLQSQLQNLSKGCQRYEVHCELSLPQGSAVLLIKLCLCCFWPMLCSDPCPDSVREGAGGHGQTCGEECQKKSNSIDCELTFSPVPWLCLVCIYMGSYWG